MLRRLLVNLFLLTGIATAQEPTVLAPPFGGLNLTLDKSTIAPNEWSTFTNGSVNERGAIYKRGGFGNAYIHHIDQIKRAKTPVNFLYPYRPNKGIKRILANFIGVGEDNSAIEQYAPWYFTRASSSGWDTTVRLPADSINQLCYSIGKITEGLKDANHYTAYNDTIRDRMVTGSVNTRFYLGSCSGSVLKIASGGYGFPREVIVISDTTLWITRLYGSASTQKQYELWPRAPSKDSIPFYAEATTYLDTVLLSNTTNEPIGWCDSQTVHLNVIDYGVCDSFGVNGAVARKALFDKSKSWIPNQWAGFWLFRRMRVPDLPEAVSLAATNYVPIISNTASQLVLKYAMGSSDIASKEYAIVSLPIDEAFMDDSLVHIGAENAHDHGMLVTPTSGTGDSSFQEIWRYPVNVLMLDGLAKGEYHQVKSIEPGAGADAKDKVFMADNFVAQPDDSVNGIGQPARWFHSRFPRAKFVRVWHNRTFWISDSLYPNSFWWSQPGRPGYVHFDDRGVVNPTDGEKISGVFVTEAGIGFGKESKIYALTGDDPTLFTITQLSANIGISAPKSVVQRGIKTWFYDYPGGFYETDGFQLNDKAISEPIRPIIDSINPAYRHNVVGTYYSAANGDFILWAVPLNGSVYANRILCYSPHTGAWSQWDVRVGTDSVRVASMAFLEGAGDSGALYLGLADSGYVLQYNPNTFQDSLKAYATSTQKTTFTMVLESKRFESPLYRIRGQDYQLSLRSDSTRTSGLSLDFFSDLGSTVRFTSTLNLVAGMNSFRRSMGDAAVGNQFGFKMTTSGKQGIQIARMVISIVPWGRRIPE